MGLSRLHHNPSRAQPRTALCAHHRTHARAHVFGCRSLAIVPSRAEPRRLGTAALGTSVCAAVHAAFGPIAAVGRIDAIAAAAEPQSAGAGVKLMAQPASAAEANGMGSGRLSAAYPWLSRLSHRLAVAPPLVVIELCDAPLRFEVRQLYAADSAVRLSRITVSVSPLWVGWPTRIERRADRLADCVRR